MKALDCHEVVNDAFDGPLLVTYCPLCGSAVTAERTIDGEVATFGVSGLLYRSNLVFYDRPTESLRGQLLATAIRGPLTGTTLSLVPSELTDWGAWREAYPETQVLLPSPHSRTIDGSLAKPYLRDPYAEYRRSRDVVEGARTPEEGSLHPKTEVLGIASGDQAVAYPLPVVSEAGVVNDAVGGRPVVVAADGERLVAYDRVVGGRTVEFDRGTPRRLRGANTQWNVSTGRAIAGEHRGERLQRVTDARQLFWFAWREFHPKTTVYEPGGDGPLDWLCG